MECRVDRECKPCCASESTQQKQTHSSPSERKGRCQRGRERPSRRDAGNPFERSDGHPCRLCQPPPPPVSGPAVVVPLETSHRIGRPVPLIVEPDYVRRQNPEKYIIVSICHFNDCSATGTALRGLSTKGGTQEVEHSTSQI